MDSPFQYVYRPITPRHLLPFAGFAMGTMAGWLRTGAISHWAWLGVVVCYGLGCAADYDYQRRQHRIEQLERRYLGKD